MAKEPDFDLASAHAYFAAQCFNGAWTLIEKSDRSPDDDRRMVELNQASLYHWSQRPDCNAKSRSIGHWQAARIHALLGRVPEARRHAEVSLAESGELDPFYRGYAYEALARTAAVAGEADEARRWIVAAEEEARAVGEPAQRDMLLADLATIAVEAAHAPASALPRNRSIPAATTIAVLHYPDVIFAARWLCDAFGFRERLRIGTHRIQIDIPPDGACVAAEGEAQPGGHSMLVRVANADAAHARAHAAGASVTDPSTEPYGERQFTAVDCGGHRWTFSESVRDVDPADWGGSPV